MEPSGYVICCEDIRSEAGGKHSYIGVFHGRMFVHGSFPATLPKFGFAVTIIEPEEFARGRDEPIRLQVYLPGDTVEKPTLTGDLPPVNDDFAKLPPPEPGFEGPNIRRIDLTLMISPLIIKQEGMIRVRALYPPDKLLRLGGLSVSQQPESPAEPLPPGAPTFHMAPKQ